MSDDEFKRIAYGRRADGTLGEMSAEDYALYIANMQQFDALIDRAVTMVRTCGTREELAAKILGVTEDQKP